MWAGKKTTEGGQWVNWENKLCTKEKGSLWAMRPKVEEKNLIKIRIPGKGKEMTSAKSYVTFTR